MDTSLVLHLARRVLEIALLLSAPSLVVTLVVGFVTGIIQAVTSVRDMSMGMVVKLAAVGITLLATGGWMIGTAGDFVKRVPSTTCRRWDTDDGDVDRLLLPFSLIFARTLAMVAVLPIFNSASVPQCSSWGCGGLMSIFLAANLPCPHLGRADQPDRRRRPGGPKRSSAAWRWALAARLVFEAIQQAPSSSAGKWASTRP